MKKLVIDGKVTQTADFRQLMVHEDFEAAILTTVQRTLSGSNKSFDPYSVLRLLVAVIDTLLTDLNVTDEDVSRWMAINSSQDSILDLVFEVASLCRTDFTVYVPFPAQAASRNGLNYTTA